MCGIVAVLQRRPTRPTPSADQVIDLLDRALAATVDEGGLAAALTAAAEQAEAADRLLRGVPGLLALVRTPGLTDAVAERVGALGSWCGLVEARLEADTSDDEDVNAALVRVRDVAWSLCHDRLRTARAVADLAGTIDGPSSVGNAALAAFTAIQTALSSLDRLEVRGRDSAGLHVLVWDHDLELASEPAAGLVAARRDDPLFTSGSVREVDGVLSFVYKAAAEIGELGDNTAALRAAIRSDDLLHLALAAPTARAAVLAHTRWASVGIISEPNAHPLNQEEEGRSGGPYVVGVLNGDVDNHADLKAAHDLRIPPLITTDAKVIPALVSRFAAQTGDLTEAFRRTVASFDGSVAIAAASASAPDRLLLALRGSGQALYVGLAEDAFVVASEPYGLVEETPVYLRMDGETPARADEPSSRGQVVVLHGERAGTLEGIERLAYDGTPLPVGADEPTRAEVTTRDIDRGDHQHFLRKEIGEAPGSLRKTLRGKIAEEGGLLRAVLGERTLPAGLGAALADGTIRRVVVLGQGTAAVAGRSLADVLGRLVWGSTLQVTATTATEFSGFGMAPDLSDTLVVAVSQSGTTTDTNRTVDLARGRGAWVVSIVNRRSSDLCDKSDGVLYTSDGRDVEMSVASTKAFYAQVAAGVLLACAIAERVGAGEARQRHDLLTALRGLPEAMLEVLSLQPRIAEVARRYAPPRRYWAVVGNGPNAVAAAEVRIKLSELCYKSIAADVTEDKKHIDLSSEPLILVCAAGLVGGTADDVAKEVAIYRAHKAAPIVIATDGEDRFNAALEVLPVPAVGAGLDFVLSTMAGHLFGYEAALAIDGSARPLREAREAIEEVVTEATLAGSSTDELLDRLRVALAPLAQRFLDGMRAGIYDGHLEASTAVRLTSLWRAMLSPLPLDAYQQEHGKVGTPAELVEDLLAALTKAVEELTRPIDAIKHQAKTVTVGISRSDEALLGSLLVRATLDAGAGRDRLGYRALKMLADLSPAVAAIHGYTRYRIEGDPSGDAQIMIVDRAGLGAEIPSRVDRNPELRGTKRRVAIEGKVWVARGRSDGRTVLLVPERKGNLTTGITLLHLRFHDHLPAATARAVLQGYHDRYAQLHDTVCETEPSFHDELLSRQAVIDLLTVPVHDLAERWRTT